MSYRASRLAEAEVTRAKKRENENKLSIESKADQFLELEKKAQDQVATAKLSHKIANFRMKESNDRVQKLESELENIKQDIHKNRTDAVLELRTNQVNVRSKAASQSEKHNQKEKKKWDQLNKAKDAMLAKGMNPYTEFRRKEIEEMDRKKEENLRDSVELNKSLLAERLIREEDIQRKAEIIERREKVCCLNSYPVSIINANYFSMFRAITGI
jgi:hypothetical protein